MRTLLLVTALLALPATATAEPIRVLAPPADPVCTEEVKGKKAEKQLVKLTERLGGDDTRGAWKDLRDLGQPGVHTIAKWLENGAAGGEAADRRGAAEWLVKCGMGADFDQGVTTLLDGNYVDSVSALLAQIAPRLPRFTGDQVELWMKSTNRGVKERAVLAMVGRWERLRGFATGALFNEEAPTITSDIDRSDLPPPQHHVEAVIQMGLQANHPGVWGAAVGAIENAFEAGAPEQQAWGHVLEAILKQPGEELRGERETAAYVASRYLADGLADIVEIALNSRDSELHVHLMDGFDDRLKEKEPFDGAGSDALARCTGLPTKGEAKRAERLLKKLER